jgi:hypothetical protein
MGASVPNGAARPKPFLTAALICERVLHETDGVLTVVRIVDFFRATPTGIGTPPVSPIVQFTILVALRSGDAEGPYVVLLKMRTPSGETKPLGEPVPINLKGGNHAVTLILPINLVVQNPGLYWIDVMLDDERISSMSLMLQLMEGPESPPSPPNSPK